MSRDNRTESFFILQTHRDFTSDSSETGVILQRIIVAVFGPRTGRTSRV